MCDVSTRVQRYNKGLRVGMRKVCEMKTMVVMMWVHPVGTKDNETEETIGPCHGIENRKTIS